jgi:hypothetical protein
MATSRLSCHRQRLRGAAGSRRKVFGSIRFRAPCRSPTFRGGLLLQALLAELRRLDCVGLAAGPGDVIYAKSSRSLIAALIVPDIADPGRNRVRFHALGREGAE